jgi:hypothetical protein
MGRMERKGVKEEEDERGRWRVNGWGVRIVNQGMWRGCKKNRG